MGAATEHDWIKDGLLIAGLQDWISLSEVHSSFLTNTGPRRQVHEVQQLTLSMIRELVSEVCAYWALRPVVSEILTWNRAAERASLST